VPARILIVDDHEIVRQGIRNILNRRPEWEVCGEAVNGREGVDAVKRTQPDLVILDITMPIMNGLEATQHIAKLGVNSRVLIFTMHDSERLISDVREAGAQGYVLKSHAARDLIAAIEALLSGGTFFGADGKSQEQKKQSKDPKGGVSFCFGLGLEFC
jgi:DNA-binding NarL/FixJ family response regulator